MSKWIERKFIIFDDVIKLGYYCTNCKTTWDTPTKYCPNCADYKEEKENNDKLANN